MLHKKTLLLAAVFLAFSFRTSQAQEKSVYALNIVFQNGIKPLHFNLQDSAQKNPVKIKQLRKALEEKESKGALWESLWMKISLPEAKEEPDYLEMVKREKEAKKEYSKVRKQVQTLQAEIRTDAQWTAEINLLQKILQNALIQKDGKTWFTENDIKIPINAVEQEAFERLRDLELGNLWGVHSNSDQIILKDNQLTIKKPDGFQLSCYALEFKEYLKIAATRKISKEDVEKWAQWGLRANIRYSHFERTHILQILTAEEYIDLKSND